MTNEVKVLGECTLDFIEERTTCHRCGRQQWLSDHAQHAQHPQVFCCTHCDELRFFVEETGAVKELIPC